MSSPSSDTNMQFNEQVVMHDVVGGGPQGKSLSLNGAVEQK